MIINKMNFSQQTYKILYCKIKNQKLIMNNAILNKTVKPKAHNFMLMAMKIMKICGN